MKQVSIKAKITAWIAVFTILIAGIALVVIMQFVNKTVWTEAENVLREAVEEFEEEIEIFPNGGYEIDEDSYHEDQVIFSIYSNEGALLSGSVPSAFPAKRAAAVCRWSYTAEGSFHLQDYFHHTIPAVWESDTASNSIRPPRRTYPGSDGTILVRRNRRNKTHEKERATGQT